MLRRLFICLVLLLSLPSTSWSQTGGLGASLRAYFEVYPDLDAESKDLVLEVLDKGEKLKFPHTIYESLQLLYVSDSTLSIRTSDLSTWTLHLLTLPGGKPLLMTIESVEEPLVDSQISFWTPEWQALETTKYFAEPTAVDFVGKAPEGEHLRQVLSTLYCHYTINPNGELILKLSTPILLSDTTREQDRKAIEALPSLRYRWTGKQWQATKAGI